MEKILEHLKEDQTTMNKNKDGQGNDELFSERNILILESEKDKMEKTKNNSIYVNLFNEQYLKYDEKGQKAIDLEGDKVINYAYKLLETCTGDIRDYILCNKITDEYSRV